jgi:protocatechuate 3,4-dioxygenase beta subunit
VLVGKKLVFAAAAVLLLGTGGFVLLRPRAPGPGGGRPAAAAPARPPAARPRRVVGEEVAPAVVDLGACDRERDLFGVVVDGEGAALGGARVAAFRQPWRGTGYFALGAAGKPVAGPSSVTAADGTFSLRLEPGAVADLHVEGKGYAPVVVPDCPAGERVRVVLRAGARVVVLVKDEAGAPVAGVAVRAWRPGGISAGAEPADPARPGFDRTETSGADGTAVFAALRAGFAYLAADDPTRGNSPWDTIQVPESGELRVDSILAAGRTLCGRVVDAGTGAALAGARVGAGWTFRRETRTGADGTFAIPCWRDGPNGELFAEAEGYATTSVVPAAGADAEVALVPGDRVVGRAVDCTGVAVAGATGIVQTVQQEGPAPKGPHVTEIRTFAAGADGRFAVAGVARDQAHGLVLDGGARGRAVRRLEPHEGEAGTIDLGDVVLSPRAAAGALQDGAGTPIPRAGLVLDGPGGVAAGTPGSSLRARTDDIGRFRFDGLAPGAYALRLSDRSAPPAELAVAVPADRDATGLVFRLPKAPKGVTIRVLDDAGAPLPGIVVWMMETGVPGGGPDGKTGPDGRAGFRKMSGNAFSFSVNQTPFGGVANDKFVVFARTGFLYPEGQEIEVVLHEAAELSGVVVDPAGQPVPGLFVQGAEDDGVLRYWPEWIEGGPGAEFTMQVPRGRPLSLVVWQEWNGKQSVPSKWRARVEGVTAPASGVRIAVHPARTDLRQEVLVLDVDGRPMAGVQVDLSGFGFVHAATDAAGRVVFDGLQEGEWSLYTNPERGTALPEGILPPRSMRMSPGGPPITMRFSRGCVREGVVLDPTGKPCPGAQVSTSADFAGPMGIFRSYSWPVLTDESGRFRVAAEPGVRLFFSADLCRAPAEDWLGFVENIPPGDEEVVIRLKPRSALFLPR